MPIMLYYLYTLSLACFMLKESGCTTLQRYIVTIDEREISPLDHFWESTGMCPPLPHQNASDYFLSLDMLQNLIQIGSVPHSGIKQVRMHWLLDMITYDDKKNTYDFTNLDAILKLLYKYNLKPGFELMGNPSNRFSNFDDKKQVLEWMNLVTIIAKRYLTMFGSNELSQWNFETWNEPDHNDFDNIVMSVEGFLKYYDACSEGLRAVDDFSIFRFGGPGGSCRKESFSKRCWALFEHCTNGTNYITGSLGSRIDFIAMHKKGGGSASYILETELETINKIHSMYPSLVNISIFNDEGDPMVGWSKPYFWRADSTYPAIVAKIIAQHQNKIISKTNSIVYSLLSNDNGFLSYSPHYFTQRTLNARFQMNNTKPPHLHFVKKPILGVMTLLAKLGTVQILAKVDDRRAEDQRFGTIASVRCSGSNDGCIGKEIAVLTYASDDTKATVDEFEVIYRINTTSNAYSSSSQPVMMMTCIINNKVNNVSQIWVKAGSPDFPTANLFTKMHDVSDPLCFDPIQIDDTSGTINFSSQLFLPGVSLHLFCWMPPNIPNTPDMLSVTNITAAQVLISWSDTSLRTKCVNSYEIQICYDLNCGYNRTINDRRVITNSFVYINPANFEKGVRGMYRIRILDFWGRYSLYSKGLSYGEF